MKHLCTKCDSKLIRCIVSGAESSLSAVKIPAKSFTENSVNY